MLTFLRAYADILPAARGRRERVDHIERPPRGLVEHLINLDINRRAVASSWLAERTVALRGTGKIGSLKG